MTAWQHWLGIAKPKNVFRSTLNLCIRLPWNFKISYLSYFSTEKRNSITTKAISGLDFFTVQCRFVPRCAFSPTAAAPMLACIMVLPKLTSVLLCSTFLSPLLCKWRFAVAPLRGFMEDLFILITVCLQLRQPEVVCQCYGFVTASRDQMYPGYYSV